MNFEKLSKNDLFKKCEELGITKYKSKTKSELIALIYSNKTDSNSENKTDLESDLNVNSDVNLENKTLTFIEVCAGGGGLSSGLIEAGFKPILLNDSDKDCCNTLRINHPGVNVVQGNMTLIDYSQYINKVDVLAGGVPCQSFSQAGLRKGLDDPRGNLIIIFSQILHLLKPKSFIIENVKGLLTHNNGETFKEILNTLNEQNLYDIKYKCINSFNYGIPQKRERVFIIGILKDFIKEKIQNEYIFPEEIQEKKLLKDVLCNVPDSDGLKYSEEKIKLFKMIPQGGCWINLPLDIQKEYLGNSYNSGGGKRGILYRLSMDKPSLTLLCSPSQKQTERCHPLEERPLTIREYARIQTFNDNYEFTGSIVSKYKQIGNAVPVELAKIIGLSLKNTLLQI